MSARTRVHRRSAERRRRPRACQGTLAQSLGLEAFISPLAAPHARIAVADLVP